MSDDTGSLGRRRGAGATVRLKIALVSAAMFLVVGGTLLGLTYVLLSDSLPKPTSTDIGLLLAPRQNVVIGGHLAGGGAGNKLGAPSATVIMGNGSGGATVHTGTGASGAGTGSNPLAHPAGGGDATAGAPPTVRVFGVPPLVPKVQPQLPANVRRALVQAQGEFLTYSVAQRNATLDRLLRYGGLALGVTTLLAFLCSWFLARRALRRLHLMSNTARRISHDNLTERIKLGGRPDELTELADTFDELLDRLQSSFAAQAHFAANASHELRTPLAIERTVADVALEDPDPNVEDLQAALRKIRAVGLRSEHLIDSLLLLAKSSVPVERHTTVDLGEVVTTQLAKLQPAAAVRRLRITLQVKEVAVSGDRLLLEQAVANLLENAVRHNLESGEIRVTTTRNEDTALLRVENSGAVLDDEVVRHLIEPFRRAAPARTAVSEGAGLGLSIVSAIATAHSGSLSVSGRSEGGLITELRLPSRPEHGHRVAPEAPQPTATTSPAPASARLEPSSSAV